MIKPGLFILMLKLFLLLSTACTQATERHALLMGVASYDNFNNLEGPLHDVQALKETLIDYWGFENTNIHILKDKEVTRRQIVAKLKQLMDRSEPDDHVFIYYSGHGTSSGAPPGRQVNVALPACSGALIPGDFSFDDTDRLQADKLVIGQRDIYPIIKKLDNAGRHIFIAFDTCFSANSYRSVGSDVTGNSQLASKYIHPKGNPLFQDAKNDFLWQKRKLCNSPYQNLFYLGGASANAEAVDIKGSMIGQYNTFDGKPHGAMTNAMLKVLRGEFNADKNKDGLQYHELYQGVKSILENSHTGQVPTFSPLAREDHGRQGMRLLFEKQKILDKPRQLVKSGLLRVKLISPGLELKRQINNKVQGINLVETGATLVIKKENNEYRVYSGDGNLITMVSDVNTRGLLNIIRQQVWIDTFMRKYPGTATFNFTLTRADTTRETVSVGDTLEFAVQTEHPVELLLLSVDPGGGVSILYPYHETEGRLMKAGETRIIPESGDPLKVLDSSEGGITGTEYILGFAFMKPTLIVGNMTQSAKRRYKETGDFFMRWNEPVLNQFSEFLSKHRNQYRSEWIKIKSLPRI